MLPLAIYSLIISSSGLVGSSNSKKKSFSFKLKPGHIAKFSKWAPASNRLFELHCYLFRWGPHLDAVERVITMTNGQKNKSQCMVHPTGRCSKTWGNLLGRYMSTDCIYKILKLLLKGKYIIFLLKVKINHLKDFSSLRITEFWIYGKKSRNSVPVYE